MSEDTRTMCPHAQIAVVPYLRDPRGGSLRSRISKAQAKKTCPSSHPVLVLAHTQPPLPLPRPRRLTGAG